MQLTVHLVFPGTCEQALEFYRETLGGETTLLFRKKENYETEIPETGREKIAYMEIHTPQGKIAGEDADPQERVTAGNNTRLVATFASEAECRRVFGRFAETGTVNLPLEKSCFCDAVGEVTDIYGIRWILMTEQLQTLRTAPEPDPVPARNTVTARHPGTAAFILSALLL